MNPGEMVSLICHDLAVALRNLSFERPWVMAGLALPAALALAELRNQGCDVMLPFDHSPTRRTMWRLPVLCLVLVARLLPAALLALAVLVLAGPVELHDGGRRRPVSSVQFCLDVSSSMMDPLTGDLAPPTALQLGAWDEPRRSGCKYDLAVRQIQEFIAKRPGDRFGLTIFGANTHRWFAPTLDTGIFHEVGAFTDPSRLSEDFIGQTDIAGGLCSAADTLVEAGAPLNTIVLVSDGGDNVRLTPDNSRTLAEAWRTANIKVCLILIGGDQVAEPLWTVTRITGGEIALADDADGLRRAFAVVESQSRPADVEAPRVAVSRQRPLASAGLILAAAYVACLFGLRYTPW